MKNMTNDTAGNLIDVLNKTRSFVESCPDVSCAAVGAPDHRAVVMSVLDRLKEDVVAGTYDADYPCAALLPRCTDVPEAMLGHVDRVLREAFGESTHDGMRWAIFAATLRVLDCFTVEKRAQAKAIDALRRRGWTVERPS